ncbi:hypothetical protein GCM10011351_09160 [Paraliobacillus quinghaiensis]|uniref:D-alanyl-D-alanine carboxypeptidase-like core domain-containing protein n=1 Tax=Paraliobacillus quinghaiensis TaxID=470815 RepID=A0A917WSP9_9BACI|nr:M15 family metallopeptidase [Paraliobacillus quinghaiensis]GGM25626.1 hypothetical protein GCM10011351_09160 [Paraliobacillus quinghaiensis]
MKKTIFLLFVLVSSLLLTACQPDNLSQDSDQHQQKELDDRSKEDDIDLEESDSSNNKNNDNSDQGQEEEKNNEGSKGTGEEHKNEEQENNEQKDEEQTKQDKHIAAVEEGTGLHIVDNPGSTKVYVNKQRKLPTGYTPDNLVVPDVAHYAAKDDPKRQMRQVAATALEALFAEAKAQGIDLIAVSGFRSYNRQKIIYNYNVENKGQEHADKYSAKPGTSEHQTGLAMDVGSANETAATLLEESFRQTSEGAWLAENAHDFGFIIRYPEGKSNITGYNYEPWHIRYIGEEIATEIYNKDITLEEYFGYGY